MKTLITILGKPRGENRQYEKTKYALGDQVVFESHFLGMSLFQELKPDRIIVLGTSGSAWHTLITDSLPEESLDQYFNEVIESLIPAFEENRITQKILDSYLPEIERSLQKIVRNCHLSMIVIPDGIDLQNQFPLINRLIEIVEDDTDLILDITHGFRHLPIFLLYGMQFLSSVKKNIHIQKIFYGAFEAKSKDGITPVLDLSGLSLLSDWTKAFEHYRANGSLRSFLPAIKNHRNINIEHYEKMQKIIDAETFGEMNQYSSNLKSFAQGFVDCDDKILSLTRDYLLERLESTYQTNDIFQTQKKLAIHYLEYEELFRATVFAFEAYVTWFLISFGFSGWEKLQDKNLRQSMIAWIGFCVLDRDDNRELREKIEKSHPGIKGRLEKERSRTKKAWNTLKQARNAIAHGAYSDLGKQFETSHNLKIELKKIFSEIFLRK